MIQKIDLQHGDCLALLKMLPGNSVDSIVTDPPYGLSDHKPEEVLACLSAWIAGRAYEPKGKGFMGKIWDAWVPGPEVWRECLRVLKPGGHVLAFAGTRSMDLMCMAIRLAGFELRDSIGYGYDDGARPAQSQDAPLMAWVQGQGFPKNHDISKAMDKRAGVEGKVVGIKNAGHGNGRGEGFRHGGTKDGIEVKAPASQNAKQWDGWGTALKPSWEPIIMARKPLEGTIAANVLAHGTGALNIADCRIELDPEADASQRRSMERVVRDTADGWGMSTPGTQHVQEARDEGRWPANVILDGSAAVLARFPLEAGAASPVTTRHRAKSLNTFGSFKGDLDEAGSSFHADAGSAARFFYCAKASRSDRNEGCELMPEGPLEWSAGSQSPGSFQSQGTSKVARNNHPTVKPTRLMRYLVRLVTPPVGAVLDPYMGSGSTGKAAVLEGFGFVGMEIDEKNVEIARARIDYARRQGFQPELLDQAA